MLWINGHRIAIDGGHLTYRGQRYPLRGAKASFTERHKSRVTSVTIEGTFLDEGGGGPWTWTITGYARTIPVAFSRHAASRFVAAVNKAASQAAHGLPPGLAVQPDGSVTGTPTQTGTWQP